MQKIFRRLRGEGLEKGHNLEKFWPGKVIIKAIRNVCHWPLKNCASYSKYPDVILFYSISDDESKGLKVARCFIKWSLRLPSSASLSTSWRSSSSQKRKTNRCFTICWKSLLFTTSELSFVAPSSLRCLTCGRLMWPTFIRTSCRISYPWCILQCSPASILRF